MEEKLINLYSKIAREAMKAGLDKKDLSIPKDFFTIIQESFDEPEKPVGYNPKNASLEKERAVMVTGGLDSTVLYFRLKKKYQNIKAFYIDIGQEYAQKEMDALKNLGIDYERITDIYFSNKSYWKHIIPGRNLYFLCLVAERIKGGIIYFGATDGEMPDKGGDKSKRFLKLANKLFGKLPYPVKIETPLKKETKSDLVRWWKKNLPIDRLDFTISCFNEEDGHCGKCQACLRKAIAFANLGIRLQTNTPILEGCQEYIKKYEILMPKALADKNFTHYSRKRCEQDLIGITKLEEWK